jgi:hypothetical protein
VFLGFALMTKLELALASLVLITKCIHLWVIGRGFLLSLVSFACFQINRRIFVLTQQSALHSCLTSLPLMVLQDAIGFAHSCQYFLRESKRLSLGSLDGSIGHIT